MAKKKAATKAQGRPDREVGDRVTAFDCAAEAFGFDPWQPAKVKAVLREDGEWWVRVRFEDGGRSSTLRPEGVRDL